MTVEGAIIQDEKTGAVIMTEKTKQLSPDDCEAVRQACPYNVPRRDDKTGMLTKCDMCIDRLQAGMVPICVKTCPTGTMVFGEREEILKIAKERLAVVKKKEKPARVRHNMFEYRTFVRIMNSRTNGHA